MLQQLILPELPARTKLRQDIPEPVDNPHSSKVCKWELRRECGEGCVSRCVAVSQTGVTRVMSHLA